MAGQDRIIVANAPLVAMRLSQAGAKGVTVAEAPAVLPHIRDWLATKRLMLVASKTDGLRAMKDALGPLGKSVETFLFSDMNRLSASACETLGIEKTAPPEPPPITPVFLRDLARYAKDQLAAGAGADLLSRLGAEDPSFVNAYHLGFLPSDFRKALRWDDRRAILGDKISNALLVPALDEQDRIVDLLAVHPQRGMWINVNVCEPPQGMIAPAVAASQEDLIITDWFRLAATLFASGKRNVLFLRGLEDAKNNAEQLRKLGVRRARLIARRKPMEIAAVLSAAGIAVESETVPKTVEPGWVPGRKEEAAKPIAEPETPPAEPPAVETAEPVAEKAAEPVPAFPTVPELTRHDDKSEQAVFTVGDAIYTVEIGLDGETKLEVRLERDGKVHLDRFDLAVEPQRRRFAISAAMRTQVPFEAVEQHLIRIFDMIRALQAQIANPAATPKPAVQMCDAERAEALGLLKRPDLLDRIAADLDTLGWVGEEKPKRLLYLIATSRKLATPLSATLRASSGSGKSLAIENTAAITPPEDLIHVSRLTDSALYYHDRDALRHKLLVIDEADALTPEVLVSLRVLQSRGALTQSHVSRDPATGATATHFLEAKGPIAVLTSTTGDIDEQVLSRCFEIPIDETPEQTERVLAAQRKLRSDPDQLGTEGRRARIVRLHWNLQRLLDAKPALIPFAERIKFPSASIRYRREQERFLNLIESSALLHQHQRLKRRNASGEEFVVADLRDYEIAVGVAADSISRAGDELSANARDVLGLIRKTGMARFDLNILKTASPGWSRHRLYDALEELVRAEALLTPTRGRGKVRIYDVNAAAVVTLETPAVRLLPIEQLSELSAGPGNKFTPLAITG